MSFDLRANKKLLGAAFGVLLAVAAGLSLDLFTFGSGLVNLSYDLLLVQRPQIRADEAVMVFLDEVSHRELSQPLNAPWDRRIHAKLVDRLTAAGAKAIVFDIVFSDPHPTSAAVDNELAQSFKNSGRVILAADNVPISLKVKEVLPPIELFRESTAAIGSDEVFASRDLIVRLHTPEDSLPSLSWAAAEFLKAKVTQQQGQQKLQRWLNYYGPANATPSVSYFKALDPRLVPDTFFKGKTVFIGSRIITRFAGERKDEYPSPYSFLQTESSFVSGVEIQATAFLNLLREDWLQRLPLWLERTLIGILGILFGYGLIQFRPVQATGFAMGGGILTTLITYFFFCQKLVWFPWLIVMTQIGVALLWAIIFNSIQLYVQKRLYEQTLHLYLSPKLVKKFLKNPKLLQPGAEKQLVTIFFSDIANFTSFSEGLDGDHLAKLMNNYFETAVSKCIHKTDGTVGKFIGDAIFAFWNAPDHQSDHALRACEAALHFRHEVIHSINDQPLVTRIGLHTGVANVGNFGSLERVDYTALGESVNLASRMEGLNKHLDTKILISRETKDEIGERLITRPLGFFRFKGFEKTVEVYELIGLSEEEESTRSWRESFAAALDSYRRKDFAAAEDGFWRTLKLCPNDGPSKFYLNRIMESRNQSLPAGWRGEVELKEK